MRAWRCDCGSYVDSPESRAPLHPQPRAGNVELEGELDGCNNCDPYCDFRLLRPTLDRLADRIEPTGETRAIERKAGS